MSLGRRWPGSWEWGCRGAQGGAQPERGASGWRGLWRWAWNVGGADKGPGICRGQGSAQKPAFCAPEAQTGEARVGPPEEGHGKQVLELPLSSQAPEPPASLPSEPGGLGTCPPLPTLCLEIGSEPGGGQGSLLSFCVICVVLFQKPTLHPP